MADTVDTCKKIMCYYLDEYVAFGEKYILGKPFSLKTMALAKCMAKTIKKAHRVYHIAWEIENRTEYPDEDGHIATVSHSPAARGTMTPDKH